MKKKKRFIMLRPGAKDKAKEKGGHLTKLFLVVNDATAK
jgi:hypothetical protein